eukprot:CAMPEP_0184326844 /NCGR_PEP_ID=MMETSP1049-20130417/142780_1 /TAXON_ID=77928 /ORGANISM="Proteomonas sulcata, Strain CCMP704" /LENGTH=218 /DNA_ID=CAMNT_0026649065 /DNA_START=107 /DNA_END=763 /DNA_ORIENTATION=+
MEERPDVICDTCVQPFFKHYMDRQKASERLVHHGFGIDIGAVDSSEGQGLRSISSQQLHSAPQRRSDHAHMAMASRSEGAKVSGSGDRRRFRGGRHAEKAPSTQLATVGWDRDWHRTSSAPQPNGRLGAQQLVYLPYRTALKERPDLEGGSLARNGGVFEDSHIPQVMVDPEDEERWVVDGSYGPEVPLVRIGGAVEGVGEGLVNFFTPEEAAEDAEH